MTTIKSSTTTTTAYSVEADTTGALVIQTGVTPTTALTVGSDQSVTFAGAVSLSGNQTITGNLTVNGNTTLGDASTDTILMTGAPSIGGAGLGMGMGFRNRIINGAMVIDQRNAGASVTPAANAATYTVDRWKYYVTQSSKLTAQQNAGSVTPPAGFTNYLGTTSSSAYSVISSDLFTVYHAVEGFNAADFAWGTASAATITISFWVRSSLTGTHSGTIQNSANNRSYGFTFTVSSANTWEQKSVIIAGDQSGTWLTTNGIGLSLYFNLGAGSTYSTTAGSWQAGNFTAVTGAVSVVGTSGATFYITGVQLEKGSTATSFDYRPYGTELALCQRYFYRLSGSGAFYGSGVCRSSTVLTSNVVFASTMRTAPSAFTQTGTASDYGIFTGSGATTTCSAVPFIDDNSQNSARVELTVSSGLTAGQAAMARSTTAASFFGFSAEL